MFDGRFRAGVDRAVKPVGGALRRTGLAPDHLTAVGLLMALPTAWAVGTGRLGLGLALLISSAIPDLLDGALAKATGRVTARGAFFDSVCDRVSDALVLGGLAWYLQDRHHGHAFALPFAILGVSLLISYERAKAESLGFDARGGLMERAERIVVLCAGLAFSVVLVPLLWVMLALSAATALQRFVKVWRQASVAGLGSAGEARAGGAGHAGSPQQASAPGGSVVEPATPMGTRWRAWRGANGWAPRPSRYADGSQRSAAAARRHERRQARVRRNGSGAQPADPQPWRRSSSRRP
ncbi:MAG: CDP-alcohol phosphatidyltransferase family protein [Acidimicrobiales bacterium]